MLLYIISDKLKGDMAETGRENQNTPENWDKNYHSEIRKTGVKFNHKATLSILGKEIENPFYYRNYIEIFKKINKEVAPDAKVLDAGCGPGLLARELKKSSPDRTIVGFDFSPIVIERNIKRDEGLGIDYRVGDLRGGIPLGEEENFDYIILSEVLEHMENPEEIIESLLMHLQQEGHLVISLPEGDALDEAMERDGTLGEHVQSWDTEEIKEFLSAYGDVVVTKPSKLMPYQMLTFTKPSWKTELKEENLETPKATTE